MLQSSIPLRAEFVQAYFGAYLISYVRPQRPWSTELIPLDIPPSVQAGYLEVLDECRGRGAQNFVKVLGRMRRLLSTSLQQDPRPLAEAMWSAVRQLRAQGRRPLVFASTEREAEALARLIACARRFRKSHPAHCKGCDLCRNFNKPLGFSCEKMPPIEGSESEQELLIFTVGADSAGLNLQSLGDALVLRSLATNKQQVAEMSRLAGLISKMKAKRHLYQLMLDWEKLTDDTITFKDVMAEQNALLNTIRPELKKVQFNPDAPSDELVQKAAPWSIAVAEWESTIEKLEVWLKMADGQAGQKKLAEDCTVVYFSMKMSELQKLLIMTWKELKQQKKLPPKVELRTAKVKEGGAEFMAEWDLIVRAACFKIKAYVWEQRFMRELFQQEIDEKELQLEEESLKNTIRTWRKLKMKLKMKLKQKVELRTWKELKLQKKLPLKVKLRNKLAKMSKREAMADIVPVAQAKAKAKGKLKPSAKLKPSVVLKASCKAKPSVKEKGSLVKKELAKNSKKSAKDKALLLALKDDKKAEAVKQAEAAKAAAEPVEDLQLHFKKGEELRVVKEEAGALQYGNDGSFQNAHPDGKASIFTDHGVLSCQLQHLELNGSSWKKAAVWKQFTQLGRLKKQEFLQLSELKQKQLCHSHEFLESCQLVDAECTYKIDKEERWKEEIQKLASNKMHIFVPVLGSPAHWALLVGHRCNSCRQTASESGQLVLSYIEAELAELASEGPASRGWPGVLAQSWDKRLEALYKQLQLEVEKVHAEVAKAKEKEKKLEEQQEQRRMKALEMLAKAKDQNSKTAQAAKAAFEQNSQYFTHKDLSPDASISAYQDHFHIDMLADLMIFMVEVYEVLPVEDVGERYEQLLKGEQSELKATPEEVQQLAAACCTEAVIDLEMPAQLPVLPKAMTRQSVQMGVGYLIQNDERFRHVVQLIGPPTGILELLGKGRPDPFTTLVQTVCHQQLSVKVCQAMFQRLLGLCGNRDTKVLHPQRVLAESADKIREVAKLSYRKIEYIQKIAERFQDGTFDSEVFEQASDDELRSRLTQLPGIGEWTLEMFLIFQLHRHGGIPYGDVAIQSAMKMIYNIAPPADVTAKNEVSWMPSRAQMEAFAKRWGPFGSIASLYLLRVADNVNAVFLPD
ncbi:unnamed protein product [Effrenium voratum]|uniref:HhH-GPD domain-containing protein n=1 Tax=Effrenium voratum TaxID=2562239 RepID=A0AA36MZH8_9DINO|nr:unnamed protein product [Effrenium voratum]